MPGRTSEQDLIAGGAVSTVGHSTRSLEAFVDILRAFGIQHLVDVRTVPRSRRHPQFNREALPGSLAAAGIDYTHMAALGGLRRTRPDSVNAGWRNASFRGYADYMQTPEFAEALITLIAVAERTRVAMMCAEAVPWRCHRSLIADALVARGVRVVHLLDATHAQEHRMTPFARVEGQTVTYPPTGASGASGDLFG